jgi:uncharacterized protein YjbJ (UPF0337 family)
MRSESDSLTRLASKVYSILQFLPLPYASTNMMYRILTLIIIYLIYAVIGSYNNEWRFIMNKEQVQGKSEQLKGAIKKTWGKLTDNDIMLLEGKRDQFIGKLKEHYGLSKEDAEKKIKALEDACQSNTKAA